MRRIIANFSIANKPTGFRMNKHSSVTKIVCDLLNWGWIECKKTDGQFLFVCPTPAILEKLGIKMSNNEIHNHSVAKDYRTLNTQKAQIASANSLLITT